MRVLHVVGGPNRGGAETWLVQVLRRLDRDCYKFDFLVHSNEHYAYEDEVVSLGSRVIRCLSPNNLPRYAMNFRRVLKEYGPYDCVHSHVHDYSGIVLALAAFNDVPIRVVQSHLDSRPVDALAGTARRIYLKVMRQLIARYATIGTAVSAKAGDCLFPPNWRSRGNWRLDPLGIDLEPFMVDVDRARVRKSLGIPDGALVIGHVGRFQEQKNHTFLADIAAQFLRIRPDAVFVLIGEGSLRPAIEARVNEEGLARNFLFLGVRSDVPKLMKGAFDAFLFPSLYEGLPLTVLEAQAAGLPCLISDSVSSEGDTRLVFRESLSNSPEVWAERLNRVLQLRVDCAPTDQLLRSRSISTSAANLIHIYSSGASHGAERGAEDNE
jgi:glycosyltransferase involved in cell wall biosynthesis